MKDEKYVKNVEMFNLEKSKLMEEYRGCFQILEAFL